MASVQEAEGAAELQVPEEIGRAIKALAADEQHRAAWAFIVDVVCGTDRLAFALPDAAPAVMGWRQGRRYVGLTLRRIAETPIPDKAPPEPPARTMVERQKRRATKSK